MKDSDVFAQISVVFAVLSLCFILSNNVIGCAICLAYFLFYVISSLIYEYKDK